MLADGTLMYLMFNIYFCIFWVIFTIFLLVKERSLTFSEARLEPETLSCLFLFTQTSEEVSEKMTGLVVPMNRERNFTYDNSIHKLPKYLDYRKKGLVTSVKDQVWHHTRLYIITVRLTVHLFHWNWRFGQLKLWLITKFENLTMKCCVLLHVYCSIILYFKSTFIMKYQNGWITWLLL